MGDFLVGVFVGIMVLTAVVYPEVDAGVNALKLMGACEAGISRIEECQLQAVVVSLIPIDNPLIPTPPHSHAN